MQLKEITINGFKSFADRTCLHLQQGVTAVVGPNGCGKSNIVDALRWVLGEQSAKALRGALMQDVIFGGTDERRSLPTCEVSLRFVNCEASLGTAFNEVEVTRRMTRESGSEYFINGHATRLKDIQRLFANTGVGRISYSFMLQGQIDQILSTNPEERRVIFEEAAGIMLYKSQRKEALNKLSLVETNLTRITDVIDEVTRQIGSLKRQAGKAIRYQHAKRHLMHLDLALNAYRFTSLLELLATLSEQANALKAQSKSHRKSIAADEQALEELKMERIASYEKVQELQQGVYESRSKKENAEKQAEFSTIRVKDIKARMVNCQEEIQDLQSRQTELTERTQQEVKQKQAQLNIFGDSDHIFQSRNNALTQSQKELETMETQLRHSRQERSKYEHQIHRARTDCTTLEVDLKTYQVKRAALEEAILACKEESVVLKKQQAEIRQTLDQCRGQLERHSTNLDQARMAALEFQQQFSTMQQASQEADRQIARKTARLNVLENLQAKLEGFGEGTKAILSGRLNDTICSDDIQAISRQLSVEPRYTHAMEALLGKAAEALFISDTRTSLAVIKKLDLEQLGQACLQIDLRSETHTAVYPELPETIVPAASLIQTQDVELSEPVRRLFDNCYFATTLEAFIQFWESHPDFNFLLAATCNGESIDGRGLIYGGKSSGKQASTIIEREAEIRLLMSEIKTDRAHLNGLHTKLTSLENERSKADKHLEAQQQRVNELTREESGLLVEERNFNHKQLQNDQLRQKRESELQELETQHRDSAQSLELSRQKLNDANEQLKAQQAHIAGLEEAISKAQQDRDQRREALAEVRLEIAQKKQHLEAIDRTLQEVRNETEGLQKQLQRRQHEAKSFGDQIQQLEASGEAERKKSVELANTMQLLTKQLSEQQASLARADKEIAGLDTRLSELREKGRAYDQERSHFEVQLAEKRSKAEFVKDTIADNYQQDIVQINWKAELWKGRVRSETKVNLDALNDTDASFAAQTEQTVSEPDEEALNRIQEVDWESIETEVAEFKERIARMGPVNLDAISEYADLKERHQFLKGQSEDLANSRSTLLETISKINTTSQELFSETFQQIRKNFALTYRKLSGGGESDLILVDSSDPLESGIDIIARPPGTRLKNLSLLSGGQRTMAAVALLFAIYLVKPSPFCALDEIDAALDDANIGRFCEILREFTDRSQFLIVTHNKRTIASADTVFGVTMPEKGVSKLLSMRLRKESA